MSDAPNDSSKPPSMWLRLNRPLAESGANKAGAFGLILFGLSGLLDVLDGRSFGTIKSVSLVVGAGAAIMLWRSATKKRGGSG